MSLLQEGGVLVSRGRLSKCRETLMDALESPSLGGKFSGAVSTDR